MLCVGVCVSVSGVGERIMAASLAKATAMQLQAGPQQHLEQAVQELITNTVLHHLPPWDTGIIAARVSESDDCPVGSSTSSTVSERIGSSGDSGGSSSQPLAPHDASMGASPDQQQINSQELGLNQCQVDTKMQSGINATGAQQQQRRQRLDFVAGFTSESFAVGYLSATSSAEAQTEVHILRRSSSQHSKPCLGPRLITRDSSSDARMAELTDSQAGLQPPVVKCLVLSCNWSVGNS